jgi:hypothetical protein
MFQGRGYQFFQWKDMMEQMPPIPSSHTAIQAIPEVVVLRDIMYMIVDHLK